MSILFANASRDELRESYVRAWRKAREHAPMEPLEALIADVIAWHPEYHAMLDNASAALSAELGGSATRSNPFLHMGLHIAIREQVSIDRPAGIRAVHQALLAKNADAHLAEHAMIEVLAELLWESQRNGRAPDEAMYLRYLNRLI
jgi:Domain of unknown function (DUF1841)